jgi:hypothetical protein
MADSSPSALSRVALPVAILFLAGAVAYIVHLRAQVAEQHTQAAPARPAAAVPQAPAEPPAAAAAPDGGAAPAVALTTAEADAILGVLKSDTGTGRTVWFHIQQTNTVTGALQEALAKVFTEAGWSAKTVRSPYGLKPGIFLMAGDEEPPQFVAIVNDALNAAGWDVKYLTGYRSYFASKKAADPNWHGPELADDQPFVIVIGSRPTPKAASPE